jgi:ATP-dependent DNA helicase RecG
MHGQITRQDVIDLCRLTPDQAYKALKRLCDKEILIKQGDRKQFVYFKR